MREKGKFDPGLTRVTFLLKHKKAWVVLGLGFGWAWDLDGGLDFEFGLLYQRSVRFMD